MSPLIAVIDNSEAIRTMLALIARFEGWTIAGYSYREVSLTTIQELKPDLIILDFIDHRIGEGWKLLQLLKMEQSTAVIPVIISTTMPLLPAEMQAYLASRDISVVMKPFDVEDFISIAKQVMAGESALLLSKNRRLPILLAEDNADLSGTFVAILELEGYLVTAVPNGQLALDAVRQGRYSMIFLDLNMPVMTGLEFMTAYAAQPGPHIPVIIFSAQADFFPGSLPPFVIGHLAKPFAFTDLITIVSEYAMPVEVSP
jgi:CheY-like chemotaxis protein